MNEVLELLVNTLMSEVVFTDVIDDRFTAIFAKEDTVTPYCVYNIPTAISGSTKDGKEYDLTIGLYFGADNFTELCAFTDVVLGVLENSEFDFKEMLVGYDNVYNEVNATIVVSIVK